MLLACEGTHLSHVDLGECLFSVAGDEELRYWLNRVRLLPGNYRGWYIRKHTIRGWFRNTDYYTLYVEVEHPQYAFIELHHSTDTRKWRSTVNRGAILSYLKGVVTGAEISNQHTQ